MTTHAQLFQDGGSRNGTAWMTFNTFTCLAIWKSSHYASQSWLRYVASWEVKWNTNSSHFNIQLDLFQLSISVFSYNIASMVDITALSWSICYLYQFCSWLSKYFFFSFFLWGFCRRSFIQWQNCLHAQYEIECVSFPLS